MWKELVAELDGKKLTMVDFDRDTEDGDAYARSHGGLPPEARKSWGAEKLPSDQLTLAAQPS